MLTSKDIHHPIKKHSWKETHVALWVLFWCHKSNIHSGQGTAYSMPCLQDAMLQKKCGHKRKWSEMDESKTPDSSAPFTRSETDPLRKTHSLFCQKDDEQKLLTVRNWKCWERTSMSRWSLSRSSFDDKAKQYNLKWCSCNWCEILQKCAGHNKYSMSWGMMPAIKSSLHRLPY